MTVPVMKVAKCPACEGEHGLDRVVKIGPAEQRMVGAEHPTFRFRCPATRQNVYVKPEALR